MPTGRTRAAFIALLALLALFVFAPPLVGPGLLRAQGTEDLSGDTNLESQRQVEALMDRMRALYAQGRYNEAIDVANQVMSADPENKIAFLFKDMSERRLLEGRTSPPVVSTLATPSARPTPAPIEYLPPPVIVPKKRSSFSLKSIKSNPVVLTIVIVVAVLVVVAIVLGVVVMRRGRDKAIGGGGRRDGLTDMPTQKSSLTDLPTRKGLADMPTQKGLADMPTARGGVADMQTRQDGGGGLYGMQEPAPPPPTPQPAPRKAPIETGMSPLVSDDEVRRPQFAPAPALAPPPAAEPAHAASSPESKSYLNLDLSDSQVSDVEATAHGRMAGTSAPPFAPSGPSGAPKSKESRSMQLPPMAPPADIAAQGPPDTQPPPISMAPPVDIGGDDPFAAPAPLFDAGGDDSFAAPPPSSVAPPSGVVSAPSIMKAAAPPAPAPADEKTVDPAISFNSLMFGAAPDPPSAVGLPPAPAKPSAAADEDNMSKTSFNRQFDEVMMGPGTEKTGIALDLGPAVEAAKDKTQAVPSPSKKAAAALPQQDLDMTVEIEPVTAKPQTAGLGSASSSSMFTRQFDSGKAAFNAGDYSKAVQCLSVAATLRPTDMEVRQLLDEARKRRRG